MSLHVWSRDSTARKAPRSIGRYASRTQKALVAQAVMKACDQRPDASRTGSKTDVYDSAAPGIAAALAHLSFGLAVDFAQKHGRGRSAQINDYVAWSANFASLHDSEVRQDISVFRDECVQARNPMPLVGNQDCKESRSHS